MKQEIIHAKAIRLLEGGQVVVDGHRVKIEFSGLSYMTCEVCSMDCLCHQDTEMNLVCRECDFISNKHNTLQLVTVD